MYQGIEEGLKGRIEKNLEVFRVKTYYKVIVLKIDTFESEIVDERHFGNVEEAAKFCDKIISSTEYSAFMVQM